MASKPMDAADARGVALVSGAARGIGAATARLLGARGHRLLLADRADCTAVVEELREAGCSASGHRVDVRDHEAVEDLVALAAGYPAGLGVVVASHGVPGPHATLDQTSPDEAAEVLGVNLAGCLNLSRAAARQMAGQRWGRIVLVASVAGKEGNPRSVAYSASKAGVIGLAKALARELGPMGVLVNCVTPGVIETEMTRGAEGLMDYVLQRTPLGRLGQPAEVAEAIAWLCSPACTFTSGAVLDVSGGRASY